MADMMSFPSTVEEFMEQYKMTDTEHVYSNGTEFVPIYRMKQWFEHVNYNDGSGVQHGRWIHYPDCGVTRCSHCGWSIEECWESKRCPECGAKMDLEGE